MKLKDVFEKSVQFFKDKNIETARLDVELLISHILKVERLQIYLKFEQPLTEREIQSCRDAIKRRSLGEPVAYITGQKGFYGQDFLVGAGVLIPRPETEQLVELALEHLKKQTLEIPKILDLGAGTGCIGFSILKNIETANLTSVEKSPEAFVYLKKNCEKLQLTNRSELVAEDALKFHPQKKFDIIVANPPYIDKSDEQVQKSVKEFEPHAALFAENKGLSDLQSWLSEYVHHLAPKGLFLLEMGHAQGPAMLDYASVVQNQTQLKLNAKVLKDLAGLDRVLQISKD